MVHATRLQLQSNRARRTERDALRQVGELLAASTHVPTGDEAQALLARIRPFALERAADSAALATSLETDRADYVTVAGGCGLSSSFAAFAPGHCCATGLRAVITTCACSMSGWGRSR
ncbi:MAG TPA: hypothetical protein VK132_08010 [Gemmatimonadales bacterium]|nr:hypothetical protein [Gemmatimonadales bacterium]